MAQKKNSEQQPNTKPSAKHAIGQKGDVLEGYIEVADKVLVVLGTILVALSAIPFYYHRALSAIGLIVSSVLVFSLLIHIHWRHKFKQKRTISIFSALLASFAFLLIIFSISSFLVNQWIVSSASPPVFRIAPRGIVFTPGRPLMAPLMVLYPSMYGKTISPIHLAAHITVTNLQTIPCLIEAYSLETASSQNGPWSKLFPIMIHDGRAYWLTGDMARSGIVDFTRNGLASILEGRELKPHESVIGWTFWECLDANGCPHEFLKFGIRDASGTSALVIQEAPSGPALKLEANVQPSTWQFLPGTEDLSQTHRVFQSECCH